LLPFTHPKLAVTAVVPEQDFATVLDRRLKRIEEMKLIEANPTIEGVEGKPADVRLPVPANLTTTRQEEVWLF
jgi:hypothetical protein